MSATINSGKLKFSLFGRGYDDTRKDSGEGEIIEMLEPPIKATSAIIDQTKQYVWTVNGANTQPVFKWDISDLEDWQDEGQTIITENGGHLEHPSNVDNNYGVHFSYIRTVGVGMSEMTITVFDMTDDTVYHTIVSTDNAFNGNFFNSNNRYDCILVDDKIYCANLVNNFYLVVIDLTNGTLTYTKYDNLSFYAFINDELMYVSNIAVWFSDTLVQYGKKLDGTTVWSVSGVDPSSHHTYVRNTAIGANNFLYMPTFRGGHWRIAKYKGKSAPTFEPIPYYSADFGKFEGDVNEGQEVSYMAFDNGRGRCAFMYGYSLYVTEDFKDLMQLVETDDYVQANYSLALKDDLLITRDGYNDITVFVL